MSTSQTAKENPAVDSGEQVAERIKASPREAFSAARDIVHSGERLDMVALASRLGVARATLYRWTGDREQLLADILWSDVHSLLEHLVRSFPERGSSAISVLATKFLDALTSSDVLSTVLRVEGTTAFRLMTDPQGRVRPRLVKFLQQLIQREADAGYYTLPEDANLIAEGLVTVGERFLYHYGNPQANPDPLAARRIMALIVRENGGTRPA